jgi:hypothetical protein
LPAELRLNRRGITDQTSASHDRAGIDPVADHTADGFDAPRRG